MTKDEKNRKIAEWLGLSTTSLCHCGVDHGINLPDFYADETASAMVRDKLASDGKVIRITIWNGLTGVVVGPVDAPDATFEHSKYLTAIAEAALVYIAQAEARP